MLKFTINLNEKYYFYYQLLSIISLKLSTISITIGRKVTIGRPWFKTAMYLSVDKQIPAKFTLIGIKREDQGYDYLNGLENPLTINKYGHPACLTVIWNFILIQFKCWWKGCAGISNVTHVVYMESC